MSDQILQSLRENKASREEILEKAKQDFSMLPEILRGLDSSNPRVRYGCGRILMDLSQEFQGNLYPHMDRFTSLLDSKYRILKWNALAIIANLAEVDSGKKFDAIFEKYFNLINDEFLVTVANVVGNSWKIALAKPYLADKIAERLLSVDSIPTTPHLTKECKRVIVEKAIKSLDRFYDKIEHKERVISFAKKQLSSTRGSLKREAEGFLKKKAKLTNPLQGTRAKLEKS